MMLVATKPFTYATRRMQAGDAFEASDRDARLLLAIKKARRADDRVPGQIPPPPATLVAKIVAPAVAASLPAPPTDDDEADIDALRAQAESAGVDVDRRWGAKRLQAEIEKAAVSA
jgi:hypothetical protein